MVEKICDLLFSVNLCYHTKHLLESAKHAVEIAIEQNEQSAMDWLESVHKCQPLKRVCKVFGINHSLSLVGGVFNPDFQYIKRAFAIDLTQSFQKFAQSV